MNEGKKAGLRIKGVRINWLAQRARGGGSMDFVHGGGNASPRKNQQRAQGRGQRGQRRYKAKTGIPGNQPILGREGEAPWTLFMEGATQAPENGGVA